MNAFKFLFWFTLFFISKSQDGQPKFRILAPQFICSHDKSDEKDNLTLATPGATTIRLQTAFGQKLDYNWTVRFKVLDGPRSQRFNLLVWKAVRSLEKTLTDMSSEIGMTNSFAINNSMLVGGVNYVFFISGSNKHGEYSDMKNFSIKFKDVDEEPRFDVAVATEEQYSVMILGTDSTYADIPYIVEADVIPCKPTLDYYFQWTVVDLKDDSPVNVGQHKGKHLVIQSGKLIGNRQYNIRCVILKISDNSSLITKSLTVNTKSRGLSIEMSIERIILAANSPINILATLKNPDNFPEELKIEWKCKVKMADCEGFRSRNESEIVLEGGFPNDGEYQFEVKMSKGNKSVTQKSIVIIKNGMVPLIEIGKTFILAVSGRPLEIQARVFDLRSGCSLQWISVEEDGFIYLTNKGNLGNVFTINSKDETFLSEIVEFGNETFHRNFPLELPGRSSNWTGLEPNAKYKFRLLVECTCTFSIECEGPKNVTTYSDVTIETNEPPVPTFIKVKPFTGFGLKTVFQFSTSSATDMLTDYPLTYTFGYKILEEINTITSFVENLMVETILPYTDNPIKPTLKVCDSRRACSELDGDSITTMKPSITSMKDLQHFIDLFKVNLFRLEYFDGFRIASIVLETLKAMKSSDLTVEFLNKIENSTSIHIYKLIDEISKNNDITSTNEFIQIVTKFIEKFTVSETFVQDILKLRDKIFEVINPSQKIRVKRDRNKFEDFRYKRDLSSDEIRNLLKVSEYIILTSKNPEQVDKEKRNLLSKLKISIRELCKNEDKDVASIDTQIVSFGVEKSNLKPNSIFYIPYNIKMGSKINISLISELQIVPKNGFIPGNVYCLAKSLFLINFFENDSQQSGRMYEIFISDKNLNDFEMLLKIPIVDFSLQNDEILECRLWNVDKWDKKLCQNSNKYSEVNDVKYLRCRCDSLGYFSLFKVKKDIVTVSPVKVDVDDVTEIKVLETTTMETTTMEITTMEITTSIVISTVTSEEIFDKNNNNAEENSNIQSAGVWNDNKALVTFISISSIGIISLAIFMVYKRFKSRKNAFKIAPNNKMVISKDSYKYRKFHAENLMEGTAESLDFLRL